MSNTPQVIGKIGEMFVTADLLARGCQVFREVTDNTDIDLVIFWDGQFRRVQIKTTASSESGVVGMPLIKRRRNYGGGTTTLSYLKGNVDIIALAILDRKEVVYLGCKSAVTKTSVSIRFDPPKNNQKNVTYAKDMTFEKAFGKVDSMVRKGNQGPFRYSVRNVLREEGASTLNDQNMFYKTESIFGKDGECITHELEHEAKHLCRVLAERTNQVHIVYDTLENKRIYRWPEIKIL